MISFLFSLLFTTVESCNDLCLLNKPLNDIYYGREVIKFSWNSNYFNNRNVWLKLMTRDDKPSQLNCYYGYYEVFEKGGDVVLNEYIENTGNYEWNIVNFNYNPNFDYYLQLVEESKLICDSNFGLNTKYLTSDRFNLYPDLNANFVWYWPPPKLNNTFKITLGETYYIQAKGFHNINRIAFSLRIMGSISNFQGDNSNSWLQVDRFIINYTNNDINNTPNWLNWAKYLDKVDNTYKEDINVKWIVPKDPTAFVMFNNNRFALTRKNGSVILLTDSDVKIHIMAELYSKDIQTGAIIKDCFDHNNNDICEATEHSAYRSINFQVNKYQTFTPTTTTSKTKTTTTTTTSKTTTTTTTTTSKTTTTTTTITSTITSTITTTTTSTTITSTTTPTTTTISKTTTTTTTTTSMPTLKPSFTPTFMPSFTSTFMPTTTTITTSTITPTLKPSFTPTFTPTFMPTFMLTFMPTSMPTFILTFMPTSMPTLKPSFTPTFTPTFMPSSTNTNTTTTTTTTTSTNMPTLMPNFLNIPTTIKSTTITTPEFNEKNTNSEISITNNLWIIVIVILVILLCLLLPLICFICKYLKGNNEENNIRDSFDNPVYNFEYKNEMLNNPVYKTTYANGIIDNSIYSEAKNSRFINNSLYENTEPLYEDPLFPNREIVVNENYVSEEVSNI